MRAAELSFDRLDQNQCSNWRDNKRTVVAITSDQPFFAGSSVHARTSKYSGCNPPSNALALEQYPRTPDRSCEQLSCAKCGGFTPALQHVSTRLLAATSQWLSAGSLLVMQAVLSPGVEAAHPKRIHRLIDDGDT